MANDISKLSDEDLQGMLKKQDITSLSDDELNKMAGISKKTASTKPDYITPSLMGATGVAGAAGLGFAANKMIIQPWKEMSNANSELRNIGNQHGINPQVSPSFIPQGLGDQLQSTRVANQSDLQNMRTGITSQTKNLSNHLANFDATHVTDASSKLANTIKSNVPTVYKGTIDNYGKGLDLADQVAQNSGFTLSNKQFSSSVLDKVIEDAQKSGISAKEIKQLTDARDGIMAQSKILDAKGNPMGTNLSLSDAKSVISNLTKEEPYSPLSAKIREAWAGFLEKEAPDNVKPIYETLNSQYKPFAEARTFLNKLSDPKTGEFDTAKLSKYIEGHIKKGGDTGINKLMSLLGEGSPLVPKIDDVSNQFSQVSGLKDARALLVKTLKDVQSTGATKINATQQANLQKVQELLAARAKANTLANIADQASTKINPLKAIGKMMLGKGRLLAGVPFGVVGDAMQKGGGYDPQEAFRAWYISNFGTVPEKVGIGKELNQKYQDAMGT